MSLNLPGKPWGLQLRLHYGYQRPPLITSFSCGAKFFSFFFFSFFPAAHADGGTIFSFFCAHCDFVAHEHPCGDLLFMRGAHGTSVRKKKRKGEKITIEKGLRARDLSLFPGHVPRDPLGWNQIDECAMTLSPTQGSFIFEPHGFNCTSCCVLVSAAPRGVTQIKTRKENLLQFFCADC